MNDIFGSESQQGENEQPVDQKPIEGQDAAPPAAQGEGQVPLKALEAERKQRREWRDKYHQLEGELRAERAQREALRQAGVQTGQPAPQVDNGRQFQEALLNERLNISEMLARQKFGDEKVDQAQEYLKDAIAKDPSIYARIMASKSPWMAMVDEHQRSDPNALREQIRQELLAEMGQATPPQPKAPLPQSLATARSAATRTASTFTGPTPLKDIFG